MSLDIRQFISPNFTNDDFLGIAGGFVESGDVTLESIKCGKSPRRGDSYLSVVGSVIVTVICDKGKDKERILNLSLITKSLPTNVAHKETFRSVDFFENEVAFYTEYWPAVKEFQKSKNLEEVFTDIPFCYSARADGTNDYIAMEDLTGLGYFGSDRNSGLDYTQSELVIKVFAKFHGLSLAYKDQKPEEFAKAAGCLKETYFSEKCRHWYIRFQKNLFGVIRDSVEKQLGIEYLKKFDELIAEDFYGVQIKLCEEKGPLAVVTHGDAWAPNFLFKSVDGVLKNARMIDFQLARYSSLSQDITFFLYACTDQKLRLLHWDKLIKVYHETLSHTLTQLGCKPFVTLDQLQADIKHQAVFGVGMAMEAVVMSLIDDEDTTDLANLQGDAQIPLETVWTVKPFKSEEKRQRIADIIKHAVDSRYI